MEDNKEAKKRGRPRSGERPERHVLQLRIDRPTLERVLKAKEQTSIYGRCEFVRILIDEALEKRGF